MNMEHHRIPQHILIVKQYKNFGKNLVAMIGNVLLIFGEGNIPKASTVDRIFKIVESIGSVAKHTPIAGSGRSETNIAGIDESATKSPETQIVILL